MTGDTAKNEFATLIVGGMEYRNWTSVRVKLEVGVPFQEFQFQAVEPIDVKGSFVNWRIEPGDRCTILLAGIKIIEGWIEIREGVFNATSHGVNFYGRSAGADGSDSSIVVDGGQYQNGTFSAIANAVTKDCGVKCVVASGNDGIVKNFSVSQDETPWMAVERLGRMFGLTVSDDGFGTWVARNDSSLPDGGADFVEGVNILEARATIDLTSAMGEIIVKAQQTGDDDTSPFDTHSVTASVNDPTIRQTRKLLMLAEEPANQAEAQARAQHEMAFLQRAVVHANIKVYGWQSAPGKLWNKELQYSVYSPMLDLDRVLWSRVVIFEQSEAGTTTTVELCTPESLRGAPQITSGSGGAPAAGGGPYFGQGVRQGATAPPSNIP